MLLGNLSGVKGFRIHFSLRFLRTIERQRALRIHRSELGKGCVMSSFKVLNRDISRKHKLKVKDLFCTVKNDGEAKAAFDWLYA